MCVPVHQVRGRWSRGDIVDVAVVATPTAAAATATTCRVVPFARVLGDDGGSRGGRGDCDAFAWFHFACVGFDSFDGVLVRFGVLAAEK